MTGASAPDRVRGLRLIARILSVTGAILVVGGIYLMTAGHQIPQGAMVFAAGLIDLLLAFLFWQKSA